MPENANQSPRISFSHDFHHSDSIPIEQSPLLSPLDYSTFNFGFSISNDVLSGENSLSAEEFFNDGKILPTEIKKRIEPEVIPIRDVKPVQEIEEVIMSVMETKPRPLTFLNSKEPGRTKEELMKPMRTAFKPVKDIEMDMENKPDTTSFLWIDGRSMHDCEIGVGLPLLGDSKKKKKKNKKKKKKNYRSEISLNEFLDVFLDVIPSESLLGLGLMNFGNCGNKKSKNFDWLWRSLFGEKFLKL